MSRACNFQESITKLEQFLSVKPSSTPLLSFHLVTFTLLSFHLYNSRLLIKTDRNVLRIIHSPANSKVSNILHYKNKHFAKKQHLLLPSTVLFKGASFNVCGLMELLFAHFQQWLSCVLFSFGAVSLIFLAEDDLSAARHDLGGVAKFGFWFSLSSCPLLLQQVNG